MLAFYSSLYLSVGAETSFDCASSASSPSDIIGCGGSFGVTTCVCNRDLCNAGKGSPTVAVPSVVVLAAAAAFATASMLSKF